MARAVLLGSDWSTGKIGELGLYYGKAVNVTQVSRTSYVLDDYTFEDGYPIHGWVYEPGDGDVTWSIELIED